MKTSKIFWLAGFRGWHTMPASPVHCSLTISSRCCTSCSCEMSCCCCCCSWWRAGEDLARSAWSRWVWDWEKVLVFWTIFHCLVSPEGGVSAAQSWPAAVPEAAGLAAQAACAPRQLPAAQAAAAARGRGLRRGSSAEADASAAGRGAAGGAAVRARGTAYQSQSR